MQQCMGKSLKLQHVFVIAHVSLSLPPNVIINVIIPISVLNSGLVSVAIHIPVNALLSVPSSVNLPVCLLRSPVRSTSARVGLRPCCALKA